MKKRIILGLGLFALMFLLGGHYIVRTMASTIYELHGLAQLHHVVALRKDLLLSVDRNQDRIRLQGTRYAVTEEPEAQADMVAIINNCWKCHEYSRSAKTIHDLKKRVEAYGELSRRALKVKPTGNVEMPVVAALRMGDLLLRDLEELISVTSASLERKEKGIIEKVKRRETLLILLVTLGPFLAVALAVLFIGGITRPVRSLLDATRRLKGGDLDHRIVGLKGEFGEVADSFNEMAASLKKEMQNMQRTEQLKICGEMAAGLAHEIRNPLAGIKVSIEVLLAELDIEERDKLVLFKVIEEIRHIELLMKNFLNFARPVAAQPAIVDINEILERTLDFLKNHPSFSAPDAKCRIVRKLADGLPETIADPQQLKQVLLNLFLNAGDAMPQGGEITVSTRHDPQLQALVIEVQDTGKGIPAELLDKIFQPFFTTKVKGTGLGLAVSKRLVEDNGGSIQVANNPAGGAVFTISLPLKAKHPGGTT